MRVVHTFGHSVKFLMKINVTHDKNCQQLSKSDQAKLSSTQMSWVFLPSSARLA